MEYIRFGKTNLQVSRLGIGAIKYGRISQEEVTSLIRRAHEGGVNYIDTARGYGDSEIRVGAARQFYSLQQGHSPWPG